MKLAVQPTAKTATAESARHTPALSRDDSYYRKTYHALRYVDQATGENPVSMGAVAPEIMSRTISRKNDQSQDTHQGVFGHSGFVQKAATRRAINQEVRNKIIVSSQVQSLQYLNNNELIKKQKKAEKTPQAAGTHQIYKQYSETVKSKRNRNLLE